ncbi:TonB-dependent receptor domain-containing protein [Caulobacter endophyticus]|nr:TonB-dependent receptor [Caulobacter endophyticus]
MSWLLILSALPAAVASDAPAGDQVVTRGASGGPAQAVVEGGAVQLDGVEVLARRGAARVAPETELGADEIDALDAYDIGEALDRIRKAYGLDEAPVVIVNGRRVLNPGDYMGFPPDALTRVEVLPQQAAGEYGAEPGKRVVNLVLQKNFQSRDGQAGANTPTAGGRVSMTSDVRRSAIANNDTTQFGLRAARDTSLRADERSDYLRAKPGSEGVTLRPATQSVGANLSMNRSLGDWAVSLGGNGRAQRDRTFSRVNGELVETRRQQQGLNVTTGVTGELAGWTVRAGLDGQMSRAEQEGLTNSVNRNRGVTLNLGGDRALLTLPAGPVRANVSGTASHSTSSNTREGVRTERTVESGELRGTLNAPLLRAMPGEEGFHLGDATLSLGGALRRQTGSDGGGGVNGSLSWSPRPLVRLNGSWSRSYETPSSAQLFEPDFYGAPIVVYDFRTGRSVEVLPLYGGNPGLRPQTSNTYSLNASAGPVTRWGLTGGINYQGSKTTDGIGALPTLTPAVEAAFPERFQRDADGVLTGIDQRPINLGSMETRNFSSNFTFSLPTKPGAKSPRDILSWRVSLNHSVQLKSLTVIREGFPVLDRLVGDGGGVSKQRLSASLDGRRGKWSLSTSVNWNEGYRIRRERGVDGADDLVMGDFTRVDLRLGYTFDPPASAQAAGARRRSGLRLGVDLENLLDARQQARRGDGLPAPGYGRDEQDPIGRQIRVSLRGRF